MRFLGLEIKRAQNLSPAGNRGGWWPLVGEPFTGAWQMNKELTREDQLAFYAVFSCITLIASDMGKLRPRLVEQDDDGVWSEVRKPSPYTQVLRKPNRFQNYIQFKEYWAISKLSRGNAYALKQRDGRGIVTALYLLNPDRVTPLVADDGSIYYQLRQDELNGQRTDDVVVPASEIIHDRFNCLYHPLVGISPLYACGIAAQQGLAIQQQSSQFFGNGARPSGILTAPGTIGDETAQRLKASWQSEFTGQNAGRVAVLGDGLKYEPMVMSATDAQLVEQLKLTADVVCAVFHVPPAKIGLAQDANAANAEIRNQNYFDDCLGAHVEAWELCMDEGLGIGYGTTTEGRTIGVDLDTDEGRWRMNSSARIKTLVESIGGGLHQTNEARASIGLKPVQGGDVIFRQQQDFPISLLADREDASTLQADAPAPPIEPDQTDKALARLFRKAPETLDA